MIYDLQDTNKICQGFSVLAILITLHNRRENPQKTVFTKIRLLLPEQTD